MEEYCKIVSPQKHRSAFEKFRCALAPLRIETGMFENLEVGDRTCPFCGEVEDEKHAILERNVYNDLREWLFSRAESVCPKLY